MCKPKRRADLRNKNGGPAKVWEEIQGSGTCKEKDGNFRCCGSSNLAADDPIKATMLKMDHLSNTRWAPI